MLDIVANTVRISADETCSPSSAVSTVNSDDNRILLDQVDRVLHSEELRTSEGLRHLLRFLAAKTVSGEAEALKEYSVATDGMGKPSSYDPRQNSAVRIQVGRLRQKLVDYYRHEGEHDPILIDIPKGRFKLTVVFRDELGTQPSPSSPVESSHVERLPIIPVRRGLDHRFAWAMIAASVLVSFALGILYSKIRPDKSVTYNATWNKDMEDLWRPFIATDRPMIVAVQDPLFIELGGNKGLYYRDKKLNTWDAITSSPSVQSLRTLLNASEIAPSHYYTSFGEVEASFILAKTLGPQVHSLSVMRASEVSMHELAENNLVFLGLDQVFATAQNQSVPIDLQLQQAREGIRNLHPGPNEPAIFLDDFSTAPSEEGMVYALVTHVPGPLGDNEAENFTSGRAAGYIAAAKAFTDPSFVRDMVDRLKQASGGTMPRYYQILLKVKFKDGEPIEISYVLAKQLHYAGRP